MKMKFGALVVAGSGKIGGHVASKNRGGAYLRTKTTPNNPQTTAQQNARALLGSLSQIWSTLTNEQRLSFDNAVASFATTDIFGDIRNPSGINLFVKLNANLGNIGESPILTAPAKVETVSAIMTDATGSWNLSYFYLLFADASLNNKTVLVSATAPMTQGTKFVKNKLRVIGYFEVTAGQIDVKDAYEAKFGAAPVGANIIFSAKEITTTGQAGVPANIKATINPPV